MKFKVGMRVLVDDETPGDYGPWTLTWLDGTGRAGIAITYPNGQTDGSTVAASRLRPALSPVSRTSGAWMTG